VRFLACAGTLGQLRSPREVKQRAATSLSHSIALAGLRGLNYAAVIVWDVQGCFGANLDRHPFDWKVPTGVPRCMNEGRHGRHKADDDFSAS
jgi:hypothetical protein